MIVINSSTRQFNIPGADLVFGVESDSGSVVKEFQCPRYVGNNLDLTSCFIRMNYRNANGEIDSYLVKEVTVDGGNIVFGWELTPKVTMYKGNVSFVMCVVGPDTKIKWHTTLGRGQVLEGLEPDSAMIEEGTADIVAQLIAMVDAQTAAVEAEGANQIKAVQSAARMAQSDAVAQIEAKGVNTLGSIPEDYTALSETVDGLVRGRAGAIVCEAAGETVVVSDASDLPMQGMRIFGRSTQDGTPTPDAPVEIKSVEKPVVTVAGKNLLPVKRLTTIERNGITFTPVYDRCGQLKYITASGTAVALAHYTLVEAMSSTPLPVGEYILSGCPDGGSAGTYDLRFNGINVRDYGGGASFTVVKETVQNSVTCVIASGVTVTDLRFEPMIRLASAESAIYHPHSEVQAAEITHSLPGIPVTSGGNYTDGTGQQWVCDEVDLERGVYVQRIKVDTVAISSKGTLDSGLSVGISKALDKFRTFAAGAICDRAKYVRAPGLAKTVGCFYENLENFGFTGSETDTLETLRTMYNGGTIMYILATPIETALSETEIAAYRALHSNYPNTTVLNDAGAHMVVKYAADTKLYIDNKITALIGG